ncbi:hypothetical protein HCU01_31130 [Halomonas cupida]|uniref:Uncharacterized protein n=1 Tax=Halomonas cupida TaxID=44933 RepID=A0ABQ0WHB6_9GAMM|nr:hypothetical protein HCU01_31130 [Halomonas cupida]
MRRLYLIEPGGVAQSYEIGVGAEGFGWFGTEIISAKREWPDWRPPAQMRARRSDLPAFVPGDRNIQWVPGYCIWARLSIGSMVRTSLRP